MQQSTLVWLLSGVMSVMLMALAFFAKTILAQVLKRLDDIIQELKNLSKASTTQEEQIKNLKDHHVDHTSRISDIELAITDNTQRIIRLEMTHKINP